MISIEDIFLSFNFKNEHSVLDTLNKLESTVLAWKQRISEESNKRSPKRYQWYFTKESPSEAEKCALYIERVEALLHLLKSRFPNLPQTFMDVIRVQYNTVRRALCKYAFCSFFLLLTYKIIANYAFRIIIIQRDFAALSYIIKKMWTQDIAPVFVNWHRYQMVHALVDSGCKYAINFTYTNWKSQINTLMEGKFTINPSGILIPFWVINVFFLFLQKADWSCFFKIWQDIGHAIVEAYSRVIVGVAFSILSRIAEILMEDDLKKPTTPISKLKFDFSSAVYLAGITETPPGHIRRSLIDQMNMVDGRRTNRKKRVKQLLW